MSTWYLASPYTKWPAGTEDAFQQACIAAGALVRAGLDVFSPIAHSHPIAIHSGIDPLDHALWMRTCAPFIASARGCIVLMMPGWGHSDGVCAEAAAFHDSERRVLNLTWPVTDAAISDLVRAIGDGR